VQTQLAEAGAYDKYLPTKKEDIKKIQRRLITLGFLPEEINGRK
jgi:SOS response regulatory protein OraA/RecX